MQYAATTARCPNCDTVFHGLDRDEDGRPFLESSPCAHPGCEVRLCGATCQELSFICDACDKRFCQAHTAFQVDGARFCDGCFLDSIRTLLADAGCTAREAVAYIREVA